MIRVAWDYVINVIVLWKVYGKSSVVVSNTVVGKRVETLGWDVW